VWRERRHEPPNLKNLKFSEVFYGGLDACRLRSIRGHRVRALSAFCRIAASCSPAAGPVKLGGRAFHILMALIEGRGAVVSKDALMGRVWPDRVVKVDHPHGRMSIRLGERTRRELHAGGPSA
jgi:DNA-binding response OmpR family regulator